MIQLICRVLVPYLVMSTQGARLCRQIPYASGENIFKTILSLTRNHYTSSKIVYLDIDVGDILICELLGSVLLVIYQLSCLEDYKNTITSII